MSCIGPIDRWACLAALCRRILCARPTWFCTILCWAWPATSGVTTVQTVKLSDAAQVGTMQRWLLGTDYRDLWTTPVRVPILDLQHTAGGLRAERMVGQLQTAGLALAGYDGRAYTFRSIIKDPSRALDSELIGTAVEAIVRDQATADLPGASVIAAAISRAAGLYGSQPELVLMPDDPRLGEFKERFAGVAGTIEEFPTRESLGARELIDGAGLFARLQQNSAVRVDDRHYLKARLVDLLLGDWDRHIGQWRWLRMGADEVWIPLPEDRDHAFSRYDGLLMASLRDREPRFLSFGPAYSPLEGSAWRARQLDRRLLNGLDKEAWREVAGELQRSLSDQVITDALARWPAAWRQQKGEFLASSLRARRDGLVTQALKFYHLLAAQVDIEGSESGERFIIRTLNEDTVEVAIYAHGDRTSADPDGNHGVRYQRRFHGDITQTLRLYTGGGADCIALLGHNNARIKVHVVPSSAGLRECSGQPLPMNTGDSGRGQRLTRHIWLAPAQQSAERALLTHGEDGAAATARRDWGTTSYGTPWAGFTPDLGVFLGYGRSWEQFAFRRRPFSQRHRLRAGFAVDRQRPKVDYRWQRFFENRPLHLETIAELSAIDTLNFFGFGNDTDNEFSADFYDVRSSTALGLVNMVWSPQKYTLAGGANLRYTRTEDDGFIALTRPYGIDATTQLGLNGRMQWDSRAVNQRHSKPSDDNWRFGPPSAEPGYDLSISGAHYPEALDLVDAYTTIQMMGRAAYRLPGSRHQVKIRLGGQRNWGQYPYYDAAVVGARQVRGLAAGRFAGDASLYGNLAVQLRAGNVNLLVPGDWGLHLRGDVGRVFLSGEPSNSWHPSAGLGLWWRPIVSDLSANVLVARSAEDTRLYFTLGARY